MPGENDPDLIAATEAQYAEQAEKLYLTPPGGGPWVRVDGAPHSNSYDDTIYYTPHRDDMMQERLENMGKFDSNNGLLTFIGMDGYQYLGRSTATNKQALVKAGFSNSFLTVPLSTSDLNILDPVLAEDIRVMQNTPEHTAEQLGWAFRRGDIASVRDALDKGVDFSLLDLQLIDDCLLFSANARNDAMYAIAELVLDAGYNPNGGQPSAPLLRSVTNFWGGSNPELTKLLLNKSANPFYKNNDGIPVFIPYDSYYTGQNKDAASLQLIFDSVLAESTLSREERFLMKWHEQKLTNPELPDQHYRILTSAWQTAHAMEPESTKAVPSTLPALLAPMLAENTPRHTAFIKNMEHLGSRDFMDMVYEFTRHVVVPQMVVDYAHKENMALDDELLQHIRPTQLLAALAPTVACTLLKGQALDKIAGFSKAWHDPVNTFPDVLRPLTARGEWHSLTQERVHPVPEDIAPGLFIHVLTNDDALEHEGTFLSHCVGKNGYASLCLEGRTHIVSVRDANNTPLSTAELNLDYGSLSSKQHKGYDNAAPVEAEVAALTWFMEAFKKREISASHALGETRESKDRKTRPDLIQQVGFELEQQNIDAAFNAYKSPRRRAYEYQPKTGKYEAGKTDFISGEHKKQDADGWMEATGLRAQIAELAPELLESMKRQHNIRVAAERQEAHAIDDPLPDPFTSQRPHAQAVLKARSAPTPLEHETRQPAPAEVSQKPASGLRRVLSWASQQLSQEITISR